MLLKFIDVECDCDKFFYNSERNTFEIKDINERIICEYNPVLDFKCATEYDPKDFQLIIMYNERTDYTENSIYQVYADEKRIGWIFPFQALISKEHSYHDNNFFLRYAYIASWILLDTIIEKNEREVTSEVSLEDFYNGTVSILVIDKTNTDNIDNFNIRDYTVSLYKYGYAYSGKGNLDSEIIKPDKRLNLKPISKQLRHIVYIQDLFEKEIPKEQAAFAKFHTYYQLIEILISVVFEDQFKKFIEALNVDTDVLFDKRDDLSNMIQEKQRVKWLFSNYVSVDQEDKNILNDICKKLLRENDKKVSDNMPDNLYAVRCLLVHSMYILSEYSHQLLDEVNKAFLDVLIEMLLSFSYSEVQ